MISRLGVLRHPSRKSCTGFATALSGALAVLALAPLLASFAWSQTTEEVLYSFQGGNDGSLPLAGLIFDGVGNLYGTTSGGPFTGPGTVFELTPSNGAWTKTILYTFAGGVDGLDPQAGLIFDREGNLYGATSDGGSGGCVDGCGTVFELTPSNGVWTKTVLHSFTGTEGNFPTAGLVFDSAGNLYGTTSQGGTNGYGTVFELTPSNGVWTETILLNFTGSNGKFPEAGLILDGAGSLYGTTLDGGADGYGTVFKLTPSGSGWTETVLYSFTDGSDGGYPWAGLIFDAAGNLYGTTQGGGAYSYGTVFQMKPTAGGSWTETVLHSFNSTVGGDGFGPFAGLIFDSAGNLYGTTYSGGAKGDGTVFKLDTNNNETILCSFGRGPEGGSPAAGLVMDAVGNLYGATSYGGTGPGNGGNGDGVVFEVTGVSSGTPAVELTPSYLVFPSEGSTLPLTVTNTGTGTLNITVPQAFSGFNSFDFSVASGTTCTNGAMVAPGASCLINVAFTSKPVTTSAESASLLLFDNATGSPQMVALSGGAPLASISPNPVPGSSASQTITVSGNNFVEGAVLNWQDLTSGGTGSVTPLSVTPNQLTASLKFTNTTAAWQIQVANPSGPPSNWYSFEVLASQYAFVSDDYPFQNATIDANDPYGFMQGIRECTSFVAWRMNRDAGTTNPQYPFFVDSMGNKGKWGFASNWSSHALALGYALDPVPQVGDIAQWVNDCGGSCTNGHVAYVEQVTKKNGSVVSIVVSEYNYPEKTTINHQFNVRTLLPPPSKDYYPQNFIHVFSVKLSANLLNFGNQTVGTSSSQTVTLTNPGTAAVPVTSITLSGTNKGDFAKANTCGSSIPAGGSCGITVTFTPSAVGSRSAMVTVKDTAGPAITQTITLTGTGA